MDIIQEVSNATNKPKRWKQYSSFIRRWNAIFFLICTLCILKIDTLNYQSNMGQYKLNELIAH
jgi:hypothetical protein